MNRPAATRPAALSTPPGAMARSDMTAGTRHGPTRSPDASRDIVEEWGRQSFPASDPPANW